MGIIGWIILGLLAGAIAKAILPGDDPGGIIITGLIGIVGAVIGGLIAKALGFGDPIDEFFDWSTWIAAIIGAILLLLSTASSWVGAPAKNGVLTPTSRRATASAAERWPFVLAVGPPDLEDHAVARRPEKDRGRRAPRAAAGAWPTR